MLQVLLAGVEVVEVQTVAVAAVVLLDSLCLLVEERQLAGLVRDLLQLEIHESRLVTLVDALYVANRLFDLAKLRADAQHSEVLLDVDSGVALFLTELLCFAQHVIVVLNKLVSLCK